MTFWTASLWLLLAVVAALVFCPRILARVKPAPASPLDCKSTVRLPRWLERSAVVGAAAFVGLTLCAVMATTHDDPVALLYSMAGPFAEPMAFADYSWLRMGVHGTAVLLVASLHPIRPNEITAVESLVAVAWWFLVGLGLTYSHLVAG